MNLLEVSRLFVRYGGADAVSDVSFSVSEGSWLMIVGPNGAGKARSSGPFPGVCPTKGRSC